MFLDTGMLGLCRLALFGVYILADFISNHASHSIVIQTEFLFREVQPILPGSVVQSVTCLAADTCLTADPGAASSIPDRSHILVEIDHEIISRRLWTRSSG